MVETEAESMIVYASESRYKSKGKGALFMAERLRGEFPSQMNTTAVNIEKYNANGSQIKNLSVGYTVQHGKYPNKI